MKFKYLVLNLALVLVGTVAALFCGLLSVQVFTGGAIQAPVSTGLLLVSLYLSFFAGVYVLIKLHQVLQLIQADAAFTEKIIPLVQKIRRGILTVSCLFLGSLPFFYQAAQSEDAPGLVLIGVGIAAIPFVIYLFSAIAEELFLKALSLKTEQDFTI
ncbi:DUF2975 domain-containing protein [Enterococcus sp. LJL120]